MKSNIFQANSHDQEGQCSDEIANDDRRDQKTHKNALLGAENILRLVPEPSIQDGNHRPSDIEFATFEMELRGLSSKEILLSIVTARFYWLLLYLQLHPPRYLTTLSLSFQANTVRHRPCPHIAKTGLFQVSTETEQHTLEEAMILSHEESITRASLATRQ